MLIVVAFELAVVNTPKVSIKPLEWCGVVGRFQWLSF